MSSTNETTLEDRYQAVAGDFPYWEKTKELIDQLIDIMLNYRQSGHPGGSRSKVHALLATLLGGVMRWDIRHPEKRFGDRFVLGAGHTVPLIYCTFAVLDEAMRIKHAQTGDPRYALRPERAVYWEDLLNFRRRDGLSGHAEMEGKTLFLKFNTGPSGHGSPAAAGLALALKRAGADGVKVFIFEGEGGLTPGATHETMNSAWGLALDNLYYVVDWNDFGIDDHAISRVVYGTPVDWFGAHGWRVFGTESGSEWGPVARALLTMVTADNPRSRAKRHLGEDAQGTRVSEVRQQIPRRAPPHRLRTILADQAPVRRKVRRDLRQLRRRGPQGRGRAASRIRGEPQGRDRRAAPGSGARGLSGGPARRARRERAGAHPGVPPGQRQPLCRRAALRLRELSRRSVRRTGHEHRPTALRWANGARGSTPSARRTTDARCSSRRRRIWRIPR